jgi:hypothetical protein
VVTAGSAAPSPTQTQQHPLHRQLTCHHQQSVRLRSGLAIALILITFIRGVKLRTVARTVGQMSSLPTNSKDVSCHQR